MRSSRLRSLWLEVGVAVAKGLSWAMVLLAVLLGLPSSPGRPVEPAGLSHIERLMEQHECTTRGLGPDMAVRALVQTPGGELELRSFEQGWRVHRGLAPGRLVAVCRL